MPASADHKPIRPATSKITARQWRKLCDACGNRCAYCGNAKARLCIEHVQPISRGGADSLDNILPACQSCNSSKGDLFLLEWAMVQTWTWERTGCGNTYKKLRLRDADDYWYQLTPRLGAQCIRYGNGELKEPAA